MKAYLVSGHRVGRDMWVHEIVEASTGQSVPGAMPFSGSPTGAQAAGQLADLLNTAYAAGFAAGITGTVDVVQAVDEVIK